MGRHHHQGRYQAGLSWATAPTGPLFQPWLTDDLPAQVVAHCAIANRPDSWLDVVGGLQALPGCRPAGHRTFVRAQHAGGVRPYFQELGVASAAAAHRVAGARPSHRGAQWHVESYTG